MDPAWIAALSALIAAFAGLASWPVRWTWRVLKKFSEFLEDWRGEAARDGVAARPGVMARLASVEALSHELAAEMRPNHGTSLRDVVQRTASDVAEIKADQAAERVRVEILEAQVTGKGNS